MLFRLRCLQEFDYKVNHTGVDTKWRLNQLSTSLRSVSPPWASDNLRSDWGSFIGSNCSGGSWIKRGRLHLCLHLVAELCHGHCFVGRGTRLHPPSTLTTVWQTNKWRAVFVDSKCMFKHSLCPSPSQPSLPLLPSCGRLGPVNLQFT